LTDIDTTQLNALLSQLIANMGNTKRALSRIGAYQERQLRKAFDENRSPDGKPWTPLSPNTIARKKNPKMLVETVGRIPASRFYEATNLTLVVGYGDRLAAIHHSGANIPGRVVVPKNKRALYWAGARHPVKRVNIPPSKLPARPLVGFTPSDVEQWEGILVDEIEKTKNS
jgi:phage virion morphogenesis protein